MVDTINAWLQSGISQMEVSKRLGPPGSEGYISRITIGNHERRHLTTPFEQQRKAAAAVLKRQAATIKGPSNQDFNVLVRNEAVRRLQVGEIEVTTRDGLMAQDGINKQANHATDSDLQLMWAQILGGVSPVGFIEGSYKDVTPEAIEDDEEFARLTSGE